MYCVSRVHELHELLSVHTQGQTIALVPTMGALHDGHFALIRAAIDDKVDWIVLTIFVNPMQFGHNEDFDQYPRPLDADIHLLEQFDYPIILFTPSPSDIYGSSIQTATTVMIPVLNKYYCGASRPQFFDGICSVCLRLFLITRAQFAYFGEKDFQQLVLLNKMVKELFVPLSICSVPIVRESNGLAMSSRNRYLSASEHEDASMIFKMLTHLKIQIEQGETSVSRLIQIGENLLRDIPGFKLDYLVIVNPVTLDPVSHPNQPLRILCAGYLKDTRLIDNIGVNDEI